MVIGEAKAGTDFKSNRSQKQIDLLLNYTPKKPIPILFVLCLPLNLIPDAKRYLSNSEKNSMTTPVIIDELSTEIYHA
jgi:hypothetical protein